MKQFTINPFKNTIIIKGFDFIEDCEMTLHDFKQLCFEKGWEGTLHRVIAKEAQIPKLFETAINAYIKIRNANHPEEKPLSPLTDHDQTRKANKKKGLI